jgi:hypothetical protein
MDAHEIRIVIQAWADKYRARIDRDLTTAWPELENELRSLIDQMTLRELTIGPGADFQNNRLQPRIASWSASHIKPLAEDAEKDLHKIFESLQLLPSGSTTIPGAWKGTLRFDDLLGPAAAGLGVGIGVAGVVLGISKATTWIIFTILVVNWYLVIAGLVVGLALYAAGSHRMLGLQGRLRERFRAKLIPKIQEAVLGDCFLVKQEKVPSIRRQLIDVIERGKADALDKLEAGIA